HQVRMSSCVSFDVCWPVMTERVNGTAAAFGLGCNLPVALLLMWLEGGRRRIIGGPGRRYSHETLRMSALRADALFRERPLRELRAPTRLLAVQGNSDRAGAGPGRVEGAGGAEGSLPLLCERAARRLQLAAAGGIVRSALPRLPP